MKLNSVYFEKLLLYAFFIISSFIMMYPVIWCIAQSINDESGYTLTYKISPIEIVGDNPSLTHYGFALPYFSRNLLNSIFVAVTVALVGTIINSLAAYGFAKLKFPGKTILFYMVLGAFMIPFFVGMVPLYVIFSELGWVNTYQGLIIPSLADPFCIFLLTTFFKSVPNELMESAKIDGCSLINIWWRIILPLSIPALGSVMLFKFMWEWNSLLWPYLIATKREMQTIQASLMTMQGAQPPLLRPQLAGAILSVIPVFILFLILQKYFVRGILTTGIKG